jgi:hypothetical protein
VLLSSWQQPLGLFSVDLSKAQNVFSVRLYDWSRNDFLRELEEGCPLLRTVGLNNRFIAGFVAWNEILNLTQRHDVATALTRRCHERAVQLKGERLTEQDQRWLKTCYEESTRCKEALPPLATADKDDPNFRPVDPDACLETLVSSLPPVLGKHVRRKSGVVCMREFGDWRISTEFTFRRRDEELCFEYQFVRKDGAPVRTGHPAQGPFPRTMLLFYGLYHSVVVVPSLADSLPMARAMANLAAYFVATAEPLFGGLGILD